MPPLVSFLVMTYGRCAKQPSILNECVYWALRQDYPDVEVVVLNDAPGQSLRCADDRVRVFNWPHRIADLGTKMQRLVSAARGTVCLVNDDDDVSLPGRATQAVEALKDYDYWSPRMWFYHNTVGNVFAHDGNGYGYNCAAFRRSAMKHPEAVEGHDKAASAWAVENLDCNPVVVKDPVDVQFVYRWGVSHCHLSGNVDVHRAFRDMPAGSPGDYEIVPAMGSVDYAAKKLEYITRPAAGRPG